MDQNVSATEFLCRAPRAHARLRLQPSVNLHRHPPLAYSGLRPRISVGISLVSVAPSPGMHRWSKARDGAKQGGSAPAEHRGMTTGTSEGKRGRRGRQDQVGRACCIPTRLAGRLPTPTSRPTSESQANVKVASLAVPSPTPLPTDPVPRGLLTLCPWLT